MSILNTKSAHGFPTLYCGTSEEMDQFSFCPYFKNFVNYNTTHVLGYGTKPYSQIECHAAVSSAGVRPITMNQIKTISAKKNEMKCGWWKCGLWFESLDLLANHVSQVHATSESSGLFYCRWEGCARNNRGFNARYKMLVHIRTHTNEKPHRCCQCHKSFSRAENLKIHSRSHSGEKPYVCSVPGCNKAYSNSSDRFKHTRTHQVEKPYLCKIPGCLKRYTDPSSLRKHIKTYNHLTNNQQGTVRLTQNMSVDITNTIIPATNEVSKNPLITKNENMFKVHHNITENILRKENTNSNIYAENIINSHTCSHTCCLKTCLTKAAELLKLGTVINVDGTSIENVTWNMLLEPLIQQSKLGYTGCKDDNIDIPLDLTTVQRK